VTRALKAIPVTLRGELLGTSSFERWLYLVSDPVEHAVLIEWVHDTDSCLGLFEALLTLQGRSNWDHDSFDSTALDLLLMLWREAGDERPKIAPALATALGRHRGIVGCQALLEAFWARFRAHEDERTDIITALHPLKRELYEVRDRDAPERELHRGDWVQFFNLYFRVDPADLYAHTGETLRRAAATDPTQLAALVDAIFDAASALADERTRTSLISVFLVAAEVANRFRSLRAPAGWAVPVARLRARLPRFLGQIASARPSDPQEAALGSFQEDINTELRLIAEAERASR
jgi:hypothetical protein